MTGISAGSFWPSASRVTTYCGTQLDAQGVAHAQRVAVTEVLAQHEGDGAGVLGHLVRPVVAPVDHDERRDRQAARLGRHGARARRRCCASSS